jgi:hypothetical protein
MQFYAFYAADIRLYLWVFSKSAKAKVVFTLANFSTKPLVTAAYLRGVYTVAKIALTGAF